MVYMMQFGLLIIGTIATVVAAVATVKTYRSSKEYYDRFNENVISQSKLSQAHNQSIGTSKSILIATEMFKRDSIVFDLVADKVLVIGGSLGVLVGIIFYLVYREILVAILAWGGFGALGGIFLYHPLKFYWVRRLRKLGKSADMYVIWTFIENHEWKDKDHKKDVENIIRHLTGI